jgi:zinc D-Ala-D-Ala carboxypeptidase
MQKKTKIIILLIIFIIIIIKFYILDSKKEVTSPAIEQEIELKKDNSLTIKEEEIVDIKKEEENKEKENKKPIVFNCPIPKKEYEDMSLLNIGQDTSLPDLTYIPKDLKELSIALAIRKELCLTEDTKKSFEIMAEEAKKENINIKVSSAFRSYYTQKILYENDLKNKKSESSNSVAKAGYSEHQLGTTIDITGLSIDYTPASDKFDGTIEDDWLKENSYLYGFIQSYPYDKEDITGYRYEPWHYRYVGKDIAKNIKDSEITIIEFLE